MIILTAAAFRERIARLVVERGLGFDVETNGREVWEPGSRIVGFSLAGIDHDTGGISGLYVPLAHKVGRNADMGILDPVIEVLRTTRLLPFSAQTEHQWALAKWGFRPNITGDGYIGARLLQLKQFGLKDLVSEVLQKPVLRLEDILGEGKYDFSEVDAERPDVEKYTCDDSINAWELESVLRDKINATGMSAVYQLEVQAALIMAEQQLVGYPVDSGVFLREVAREEAAVKNLELDVFRTLGTKPFTINSGVQLGKALNKLGVHSPLKTPLGKESWTQDSLEMLGDGPNPNATVMMIRDWKSRFSVVNGLKRSPVTPAADGNLHPRWRSIGITGGAAMYSEGPALTNLPELARRAILAPPDRLWLAADWIMPELHFWAAQSGDKKLKDILANREDPFVATANVIGLCATDTPSKLTRKQGKQFLYRYLLSAGEVSYVASYVGLPVETTADCIKAFEAAFSAFTGLVKDVAKYAASTRHVRSWMNRRKKLDHVTNEYEAMRAGLGAFGRESVATAQKVVLSLLDAQRARPLLRGMAHLIPNGDVLYYTVPNDTPLVEHMAVAEEMLNMNIGTYDEPFKLRTAWSVGRSWGELLSFDPAAPFAEQALQLQMRDEEAA